MKNLDLHAMKHLNFDLKDLFLFSSFELSRYLFSLTFFCITIFDNVADRFTEMACEVFFRLLSLR